MARLDITRTNDAVTRLLDVTETPRRRFMLMMRPRSSTNSSLRSAYLEYRSTTGGSASGSLTEG